MGKGRLTAMAISNPSPGNSRDIAAAVLTQSGGHSAPYATSHPLEIRTLQLADPKPGEVLVRIDAAGLCHSDLSVINGDRQRPMPMALGHEAAATVLALGDPEEAGLAVGDRAVLVFLPSCGQCPPASRAKAICVPMARRPTARAN